ncbi:hypothetical protein GGS21DRAFT_490194 [Xylaria nigripes]|nr:hypothetical protein GGS21DRAFT_490194 [Xylaria nigripes]
MGKKKRVKNQPRAADGRFTSIDTKTESKSDSGLELATTSIFDDHETTRISRRALPGAYISAENTPLKPQLGPNLICNKPSSENGISQKSTPSATKRSQPPSSEVSDSTSVPVGGDDTKRPETPLSITLQFANLAMDEGEHAESSKRMGKMTAKQNPTKAMGGDARMQLPQATIERSPSKGPIPYSHRDHARDAAVIVELGEAMALGRFTDIDVLMSVDIINTARRVLYDLPLADSETLRSAALARVEIMGKAPELVKTILTRFIRGPLCDSPLSRPQSSPSKRKAVNDEQLDEFEHIDSGGMEQRGWSLNAQPFGDASTRRQQYAGRGRAPRGRQRLPNFPEDDSERGLMNRRGAGRHSGRSGQPSPMGTRANRPHEDDNYFNSQHNTSGHDKNIKIEHQLFVYKDIEPISSYLSKLDHLVYRYGHKRVLDHLGVGILLDSTSAGAKWFMALASEQKELLSSDYDLFKSAMKKRFAKDRNTMMRKGDSITHSFEKEDQFSVNDYIDEKVKWYNEAGSLSEDWQALRVYNGLDDHLKAKITMYQTESNTVQDLREQVAEQKDAAYEDWAKRRKWMASQEKSTEDNARQICELRNLLATRQQRDLANRLGRRPDADVNDVEKETRLQMPSNFMDGLKEVQLDRKPSDDTPPRRWNEPQRSWNGNSDGRRQWQNGQRGRRWNEGRFQRNTGDNPPTSKGEDAPYTDNLANRPRAARVFLVEGQPCVQDDESGKTFRLDEDDFPSILEQMEQYQTPLDDAATPTTGTLDDDEDAAASAKKD